MSAIFLDVQAVKSQIAALRHNYPELASEAQLLEDSIEGSTDLHEVVAKLVRVEREAASFSVAIKAQEEVLAYRRARYVEQQQIYRSMIHTLMDAAGQTKLRIPEATLSVSQGRPAVVITDEDALPDKFVKIERTPKKADILAALLVGTDVPGATKSNSKPILSIRV